MYAWVDEGKPLRWIARALSGLEDGGIHKKPTPRQHEKMNGANAKGNWDEGSLNRMLEFPGYMGRWPAYRTKREARTDDSERHLQRKLPEDEWVWVEPSPVTKALVAPEQWQRVQQRLASNKLYSKRNSSRQISLREALLQLGMARCSLCRGPMEPHHRSRSYPDNPDGSRVFQYRCRASRLNFPACQGIYCLAEPLDRAVQIALYETLRNPETLRRLAQRSQDRDRALAGEVAIITPTDQLKELEKQLTAKKRELENLTLRSAVYEPGAPELAGYNLAIATQGAEVKRLEADCAKAKREAQKYERVEQAVFEWEQYLETARDNVDLLGNPAYLNKPEMRSQHRRWLEALGARVIVNPHSSERLATLQLHLKRLDLVTTPTATGAADQIVDVPVVPVPAEPRRPWHDPSFVHPSEAEVAAKITEGAARWRAEHPDEQDPLADEQDALDSDFTLMRSSISRRRSPPLGRISATS